MSEEMTPTALLLLALLVTSALVQTEALTKTNKQDADGERYFRFSHGGASNFSAFLVDSPAGSIIAAARNHLFRLDLVTLEKIEASLWAPPNDTVRLCLLKGQSEEDCNNYVRILLPYDNGKLIACGTFAFSPRCTVRPLDSILDVEETINGLAKCSHSPHSNITALVTKSGDYYVASPTDFSGHDFAIYRAMGHSQRLRTMRYNNNWLNYPSFVGAFETDKFVYFFFREVAVEYSSCGNAIFSRVGRVCKNDSGGQLILKDNWTTFLKARLNCSVRGEFPFYYNEIQSVTYIDSERIFYATFTTPANGIAGSAVCSFTLDTIEQAFSGPFKWKPSSNSIWEPYQSSHSHFECNTPVDPRSLLESERLQLMDHSVHSTGKRPLFMEDLQRFTHIAVDVVSTKLHRSVHVIYVATLEGNVKKYSLLPRTQEVCLVEVIEPFKEEQYDRTIKTLQFYRKVNSLYIGTNEEVIRIPAARCSRFKTRNQCLNAMDPYCGWDSVEEACVPPPQMNSLDPTWEQSITSCPLTNLPVNGSWSNWSDWSVCSHSGEEAQGDRCLCRHRQCDNPPPKNGGHDCAGHSMEVTNCSRHGHWTEWSAWSSCSQTCGLAVKTRRRICGNPEPAFGGRLCVGPDRDEIYCTSNPPCPAKSVPAIDGQWSDWGPWNECTASCGGGFRSRQRQCDNPAPQNGGSECVGCGTEFEICNTHPCGEARSFTAWTPWLTDNVTAYGTIEKRFRFSCKAPVDVQLLKVGPMKHEERICHKDGTCIKSDAGVVDGGWTEWSEWSECSKHCGGGKQFKTRSCDGKAAQCDGPSRVERACKLQPCKGTWSCWTDWTPCSVSCGQGIRHRRRNCIVEGGSISNSIDAESCKGPREEKEFCNMPSCEPTEGWNQWSEWSSCDESGLQRRIRKCSVQTPGPRLCQGHSSEERFCTHINGEDNVLVVASTASYPSLPVGAIIGACIAGLLLGTLATYVGLRLYRKKKKPRIPSSPHYLTKSENYYASLGSIDRKNANTETFILKSPPKKTRDSYPTATIKRNSNGQPKSLFGSENLYR